MQIDQIKAAQDIALAIENTCTESRKSMLVVATGWFSVLIFDLIEQNRELSERVARLENTLAELENNA